MTDLLTAQGLTRSYGSVAALQDVDLEIRAGEVHAVLGENGAGKTTLMNLLFGLVRPDSGTMHLDGKPFAPASPAGALAAGIGMVHQHFMLVPALTVWENLHLANPLRPRWRLPRREARRMVHELSDRFGLELDPDALVDDLAVGARQRLEILKALARDVRLLILDEPTAVLAPPEVGALFRVLEELRANGTSILFISHKLEEVLQVADRITVLRGGRVTARCDAADADVPTLTRSIVGDGSTAWARRDRVRIARRDPGDGGGEERDEASIGDVLLSVRGLSGRRAGRIPVRDVSFDLRAGEILGVTGVDGNGQDELVALLAGVAPCDAGVIRLLGRDVSNASTGERWRAGLSVLPGDRRRDGLVPEAPVWENLALREYGSPWARRGRFVDPARHVARAVELMECHDIRATGPFAETRSLSGGNQQKLLFAREIAADPSVVVLSNPTRGLDVGAADALLRELESLRDAGRGVVLVSTELDEVLEFADRVAVMVAGQWIEAQARTRESVGRLMLGASE